MCIVTTRFALTACDGVGMVGGGDVMIAGIDELGEIEVRGV